MSSQTHISVYVVPGDPRRYSFLHDLLAQCKSSSLPVLVPSYTCLLPPGGLVHTLLSGTHITFLDNFWRAQFPNITGSDFGLTYVLEKSWSRGFPWEFPRGVWNAGLVMSKLRSVVNITWRDINYTQFCEFWIHCMLLKCKLISYQIQTTVVIQWITVQLTSILVLYTKRGQ